MFRPRRRAGGLLLGSLLLFLAGTNIQSGWLFVLSALLLGATVGGAILPALMVRGIEVERQAPEEAFAGDEITVSLHVRNASRSLRLGVEIRDGFVAPSRTFIPSLGAGERVVVRTSRHAARRGVVEGAPIEVASSAPLGVSESRRTVAGGSGRTIVFPRVVTMRSLPFVEGAAAHGRPSATAVAVADTGEMIGVREYRRGDSLRHVHWPATARHGSLVVRELAPERPGSLTILVDTWADSSPDEARETVLDLACSAAASVAIVALERGHHVRLGAAVAGRLEGPPSLDRRSALEWLASLQAAGGPPFPVVIEEAARHSPAGAFLLVVPTWHPNRAESMRRGIEGLRKRGASVTAVLVDASAFAGGASVLDPAGVEQLTTGVQRAGAAVAVARAGSELAVALEELGHKR